MKSSITPLEEKIIKDYEEQAEEIIMRMYQIFVRAQRKVEDSKYRTLLEKIERQSK